VQPFFRRNEGSPTDRIDGRSLTRLKYTAFRDDGVLGE